MITLQRFEKRNASPRPKSVTLLIGYQKLVEMWYIVRGNCGMRLKANLLDGHINEKAEK